MITNNLWEESSDSFNCSQICGVDAPFFMPLERTDLVSLRVQVPWQYVQNNGGGLPTNANVSLSIVDEIGTTTLANLATANLGQFILGTLNDGTNKIAQYEIYAPIPMAQEVTGLNFSHYYIDVATGDRIRITGGDGYNTCDFIFGVDTMPDTFYMVKSNRIAVPAAISTVNGTNVLYKNEVITAMTLLYTSSTVAPHENLDCFRFKFTATFTTSGKVWTMYTKPFRVTRCDESVKISGSYPSALTDCLGYRHDLSMLVATADPNYLNIRVPADVDREANRVKKLYNANCYNYKAEITRRYRLKGDPVPDWFASEVENVMMTHDLSIDNVGYLMEDSEQIFQNNDFDGSNYQYIDLPLSSCKCEKIFVC